MCVVMQLLSIGKRMQKRVVQIAAFAMEPIRHSICDHYFKYVRPSEVTTLNWQQKELKSAERQQKKLTAREEKQLKRKKKKRGVKHTIALLEEMKSSGKIR